MRLVLCAILLMSAAVASAQDNYPEIPEQSHGPVKLKAEMGVAAWNHLISIKLVTPFSVGALNTGRKQYAAATLEALSNLRQILDFLESGKPAGRSLYVRVMPYEKELATAAVETRNLFNEFRAELTKLGNDVDTMKKDIETFKDRFRKVLAERFMKQPIATRVGQKGRMFHGPEWAIASITHLKREGLLVGYPDGMIDGGDRNSRYEMAVAAHATAMNVVEIANELDKQANAIHDGPLPRNQKQGDFAAEVQHARRLIGYRPDLLRLIDEFYFEIVKLGGDPEQVVSLVDSALYGLDRLTVQVLGEAGRNFSDVPPNHWAAKAVNELKAAGILNGYTSKKYGG